MNKKQFEAVWATATSLYPTRTPPGSGGYWTTFQGLSAAELTRAFAVTASESDWFPGIATLKKALRSVAKKQGDRERYEGLSSTDQQFARHNETMKQRQRLEHLALKESDPDRYARIERVKKAYCDEQLCPECYGAPHDGCKTCHGVGWDVNSTLETRMAALQKAGAWMPMRFSR